MNRDTIQSAYDKTDALMKKVEAEISAIESASDPCVYQLAKEWTRRMRQRYEFWMWLQEHSNEN